MENGSTIQHSVGDRWTNLRWPLGAVEAETVEVHDATIRMIGFYGCRAPDGAALCLRGDITEANGWRRTYSAALARHADEAIRSVSQAFGQIPWAPKARCPMVVPDPREARTARRREIDAVLREDARCFPAFATARKNAVLAACENTGGINVEDLLRCLHRHEARRGITRGPLPATVERLFPFDLRILAAYERARALP